jgi:hypothetical protein
VKPRTQEHLVSPGFGSSAPCAEIAWKEIVMRRIVGLLSLTLVAALPSGGFVLAESFPVLRGPYLGQTPPGATPEAFAPGVVSTEDSEGCYGFMDGGRLFVFSL